MLIRTLQRGEVTAPSAGKDRAQWPIQVLTESLLLGKGEEQNSAVGCEVLLCSIAHVVISGTCTGCNTCSVRALLLISLEFCYPGLEGNPRNRQPRAAFVFPVCLN